MLRTYDKSSKMQKEVTLILKRVNKFNKFLSKEIWEIYVLKSEFTVHDIMQSSLSEYGLRKHILESLA